MYVETNTEARSLDVYCRGRAIIITYSKCLSAVLFIHHAVHMCYIIRPCGLSGCTIFFQIIETVWFSEKHYWTWNVCLVPFTFVWNFYPSRKNRTRYCRKYA